MNDTRFRIVKEQKGDTEIVTLVPNDEQKTLVKKVKKSNLNSQDD